MKEETILRYDAVDSLFFFSSSSYSSISFFLFLDVVYLIWMWVVDYLCLRLRYELSMGFDIVDPCFVHINLF